ncbi:hypothetical protein KAR91_66835 [Candidatus Pacearchaeota archaeon]|nr:hypothetical protein [Candidatus Pacearchaeota archaeon]
MQNIPQAPDEFTLKIERTSWGFKITSPEIPDLELAGPWLSELLKNTETVIETLTEKEEEN